MKVYLAGPINGCDDATAKDWREYTKQKLHPLGIETIDPMRRDYRGVEMEKFVEIVEGDKKDIDESDVVLANASVPSAGTSMEILYAWESAAYVSKDLLIISIFSTPGKNPSPWVVYHSDKVVRSLDEAIQAIQQASNTRPEIG